MITNVFFTMGYPQAIVISVAFICVATIVYRILLLLRDFYEDKLLYAQKHCLWWYPVFIILVAIASVGSIYLLGYNLHNNQQNNIEDNKRCKCEKCDQKGETIVEIHSKNIKCTCKTAK